ncbi:MAG: hypothetical protein QXT54_04190 [Thermoplasmatales archaeon]
MTLSRVYIIPHGDEIISMPNEDAKTMNETIKEVVKGDPAETVLIISPHSIRISTGVPVVNTSYASGNYEIGEKIISGRYEINKELNSTILSSSQHFVETFFISSEGDLSNFPLDFGSLIPLTFFNVKKISLMGQWRVFRPKLLKRLGELIYDSVDLTRGKISVIFSADQAHTHSGSGPYGYDPSAKVYDEKIKAAITKNDFLELMEMKRDFVEAAKPDSYWSLVMFSGFVKRGGLSPSLHYYYIEKYFGMLLASAE